VSEPCPCCGRPLPASDELRIDPAGIVVCNGRFATLTRQEASLLTSLHSHLAKVHSKDQLLSDLYWRETDEPDIKIIDIYVHHIRRKLAPLGVTIQTVWGRGYRLLPPAQGKVCV
jgi:DNA-binding response OmpR family regulator